MPKAGRVFVALSVTVVLLVALAVLMAGGQGLTVAEAQESTYHTLRVYGRANQGAGPLTPVGYYGVLGPTVADPGTGFPPEDAPYTEPEPIFNPQLEQAPIKDSITFNPLFMSEFETFDENRAQGLYNKIFAGARNATEKVWFRMWYEPWHWDKDLNADNFLDIDPDTLMPYPQGEHDEWYPAVMQEFTYMLLEADLLANEPQPLAGQVGRTSFVFPVGLRQQDLFEPGGEVDTTSANARYGYGLTSLDGDFDGEPDIVYVESELTLFDKTRIAADFDGDGDIEALDRDADDLSGDELAIFRLGTKSREVGEALQFLDHLIIVKAVFNDSVLLDVWYTGDMVPAYLGNKTIFVGDMLLSGSSGPGQHIRAASNGGPGTNACDFPTGPWFAYLESIDQLEDQARLMVGRALGATYSAMEEAPFQTDLWPGDPWFLKRFYVDGHEYNVVAIKTEDGAPIVYSPVDPCDLDTDDDGEIDVWTPPQDPTRFKFITIRTPIPKEGTYDDPLTGYLIEQHSVRLQPYEETNELSVLPPYNYEHYLILDVQAIDWFTCDEDDVDYIGPLVGPVPPILQQNGPFPYQGVGPYSPYSDPREMALFYVEEGKNPQFLGELKQKYGEDVGAGEFWYVEQFHTLPWEYTEFVLPDVDPAHIDDYRDLYLLTSAFTATQSEYVLFTQDVPTDTTPTYNLYWDYDEECWARGEPTTYITATAPIPWSPRVKFWFDPAEGGKKYKDDQGIRLYGYDSEGPGEKVDDPEDSSYPVEVWPYTDTWAVFNPQMDQAPRKDSLTFNPAYMNEFIHGNESLASLYRQISIREQNAYEKVFLRMWYEPEYLDKILVLDPVDPTPPFTATSVYTFPAVMQEFTYMYLDTRAQPASAQPGSSAFAFPMATAAGQLPRPDPLTFALPAAQLPSFGWGLTSFDANFDGQHDIVFLHSEQSLSTTTGIQADFDGDSVVDWLDEDATALNGNELVIFALEDMLLQRGESVQFLDHMVTLENVSASSALLKLWYTGGGYHPVSGGFSLHPDELGSYTLQANEMAIVNRFPPARVLPAGGDNLGSVDGAWFVFVNAINSSNETVSLLVGRALGATHSAMDDGAGGHDLEPGDPWYLKRFFVDGHEYNVVAVYTEPAAIINPGDEDYEFKYITIRTPVPKENFVNYEDSQKLEGYYSGVVWGVDTSYISVMPPFNFEHTSLEDVQDLAEREVPPTGCLDEWEQFVFGNRRFYDTSLWCPPVDGCLNCRGKPIKNIPPFQIRIVDEDREPQFSGELKEKYYECCDDELWQTEQWRIVPDQYTELQLPAGQKYLVTSNWQSNQSRAHYYGCGDGGCYDQPLLHGWSGGQIPDWNVEIVAPAPPSIPPIRYRFYDAQFGEDPLRVKFWYDPQDPKDIYVNTWQGPGPAPTPTPTASPTPPAGGTGTITGKVTLMGRTNFSGAVVTAGGVSAVTDASGYFTLSSVPVGTHDVVADMDGYLEHVKSGVVLAADAILVLPDVQLLGGDANDDCLVNIFDLVIVSWNYDSSPPSDPRADINGNNIVDIFDLVLVGANLDQACPGVWAAPSMAAPQAVAPAHLRVWPADPLLVGVGGLVKVTLELEDVENLFGVDVRLTFDPDILEVMDADAVTPGVQIHRGTFPDPQSGEVALDEADNEQGTVQYVITLVRPAEPVSGDGTLCSITFRAKAAGTSALAFESATLLDPAAVEIEVTTHDGAVQVGDDYTLLYLPIIRKAGPR